jgi:hypothetical protein
MWTKAMSRLHGAEHLFNFSQVSQQNGKRDGENDQEQN